ncbi:MAG TPA: metallophosphoesterase family protein, partial [Myxococcota bacterium]|nr:metallophosphoesterase family protein [Myxococcota bacterium]
MKKLTLVFILAIATGLAACNPSGEFSSSLSLIPPLEDVIIIEDISMPSDVFGPADIIPDSVGEITVTDAIADVTVLPRYSYVVVIADTHIKTPDGLPVANATKIGQEIEKMPWPIEAVFVLGDVCYLLPYTTFQEFMDDPNDRFDIAQEIFENYPVPVYPLIGNHDIDNGPIPLVELGEQLFKHHFGVDPYYAVDVGRWRFLAMSNFKGPTHIVGDPG